MVLTGYPISRRRVHGGAQRVMCDVCQRITELGWTCVVLQNDRWRSPVDPGADLVTAITGHATRICRWGASEDADGPATDIVGHLLSADVVICVDRFPGSFRGGGKRVLMLSNLAYDNERAAARAPGWDAIWVPSPYLREEVLRHRGPHLPPVLSAIVPPALDEAGMPASPPLGLAPVSGSHRLLFPHRVDPGKGLMSAMTLLGRLVARDPRWHLLVLGSDAGEPAARSFLELVKGAAAANGIEPNLEWLPWLAPEAVRPLYQACDATLIATVLPEGFGLVALESITAGTPVLAAPSGNLRSLASSFPSIRLVPDINSEAAAELAGSLLALPVPRPEAELARSLFHPDSQRRAVRAALANLKLPA